MKILAPIFAIILMALAGCEAEMSQKDRDAIDNLSHKITGLERKISTLNEKLNESNKRNAHIEDGFEGKLIYFGKPKHTTQIDRAISQIVLDTGFTRLEIHKVKAGKYRVEAIDDVHHRKMVREFMDIPNQYINAANMISGYWLDLKRLINDDQRGSEKELALFLMQQLVNSNDAIENKH